MLSFELGARCLAGTAEDYSGTQGCRDLRFRVSGKMSENIEKIVFFEIGAPRSRGNAPGVPEMDSP